MFVVLSGVETAEGEPTPMEAFKAVTKSLSERLGDSLYERYMNGFVSIEFDKNGEVISVSEADDGYGYYGYDHFDDVCHGSSVC